MIFTDILNIIQISDIRKLISMATRFTTRSIVPLNLRMPPVLMEGGGGRKGDKRSSEGSSYPSSVLDAKLMAR